MWGWETQWQAVGRQAILRKDLQDVDGKGPLANHRCVAVVVKRDPTEGLIGA